MSRTASACSAALAALLVCAAPGRGDDALPAKMQAALFKKILAYDRKLADRPARVGVFSGSDEDAAAEMVDAFRQVGLQAAKVKAADLDRPAPAFDVLYQMPGSATGRLGGACVRLSLLSLAGEAAPADAGSVSVGLGTRDDGRPEIVIHLARVKQEGHEFPAELLRLARIVH